MPRVESTIDPKRVFYWNGESFPTIDDEPAGINEGYFISNCCECLMRMYNERRWVLHQEADLCTSIEKIWSWAKSYYWYFVDHTTEFSEEPKPFTSSRWAEVAGIDPTSLTLERPPPGDLIKGLKALQWSILSPAECNLRVGATCDLRQTGYGAGDINNFPIEYPFSLSKNLDPGPEGDCLIWEFLGDAYFWEANRIRLMQETMNAHWPAPNTVVTRTGGSPIYVVSLEGKYDAHNTVTDIIMPFDPWELGMTTYIDAYGFPQPLGNKPGSGGSLPPGFYWHQVIQGRWRTGGVSTDWAGGLFETILDEFYKNLDRCGVPEETEYTSVEISRRRVTPTSIDIAPGEYDFESPFQVPGGAQVFGISSSIELMADIAVNELPPSEIGPEWQSDVILLLANDDSVTEMNTTKHLSVIPEFTPADVSASFPVEAYEAVGSPTSKSGPYGWQVTIHSTIMKWQFTDC